VCIYIYIYIQYIYLYQICLDVSPKVCACQAQCNRRKENSFNHFKPPFFMYSCFLCRFLLADRKWTRAGSDLAKRGGKSAETSAPSQPDAVHLEGNTEITHTHIIIVLKQETKMAWQMALVLQDGCVWVVVMLGVERPSLTAGTSLNVAPLSDLSYCSYLSCPLSLLNVAPRIIWSLLFLFILSS